MSKTRATGRPARAGAFEPRAITTAGLLAALLSASVLLTVRVGPVPFTMQVLVVVLAALLLPPATAGLAVGTYLVAGAAGLPVFSGMTGGLGVIAGPTGGYLAGFLAGAVAGSFVRESLASRGARPVAADAAAAASVVLCTYALGTVQLALVAHLAAGAAIAAGVVPFIALDAAKAAGAVAVAAAVRRARARA